MNEERFRAIILMLSAPQPGEVFNAAQLLGKYLKDNGYDWFDFAAKVSKDFKGINEEPREPPKDKKPRKQKDRDRWYRSQSGNLVGIINNQKCTIFKSKDYGHRGEFVAVINLEDGDTRWERGFHSEEHAQTFMTENYS